MDTKRPPKKPPKRKRPRPKPPKRPARGTIFSTEHIRHLSEALSGRTLSEDHKRKIGDAVRRAAARKKAAG